MRLPHDQRRVFLEEIAYLRTERDRFRLMAGEEALSCSAQLKAGLRADGCNRAIWSLRNVYDGLLGMARQATEDALAAEADEQARVVRWAKEPDIREMLIEDAVLYAEQEVAPW